MEKLAVEYVAARVARGEISVQSAKVQLSRIRGLLGVCTDVATIDRRNVLTWQARLGEFKPGTRRIYLSTISGFCAWLVMEGHLAVDPTIGLPKIREPRRVPRALDYDAVVNLLMTVDTVRFYAVTWLMLGCGLRCVEVSRLNFEDWNRDAGTLLVRGKGGNERVLPVPAPVRLALDNYLLERGEAYGPLIRGVGSKASPEGRLSSRWLSRKLARLMTEAGLHVAGDGRSAHSLRHTCASDVLETCHDVTLVQEMLGHKSLETTRIYLRRANMGRLRTAMAGRDYGTGPPDRYEALRGAAGLGAHSPETGGPTKAPVTLSVE